MNLANVGALIQKYLASRLLRRLALEILISYATRKGDLQRLLEAFPMLSPLYEILLKHLLNEHEKASQSQAEAANQIHKLLSPRPNELQRSAEAFDSQSRNGPPTYPSFVDSSPNSQDENP